MALALFGGHEHHVAHELRSRPYHGHVALEDVEEFGELVEAGAAQEPAVGGQAHVVGEQFPAGVALVCHGAELDELEYLFALPGPGLREEGVPAHLDGPNQRKENEQRAQAAQGRKRAAEVQDSFEAAWVHDTNIGYSQTGNEQITRKMSKNLHTRRPQNEPRESVFCKERRINKIFRTKMRVKTSYRANGVMFPVRRAGLHCRRGSRDIFAQPLKKKVFFSELGNHFVNIY